jgi:hypothetical protein
MKEKQAVMGRLRKQMLSAAQGNTLKIKQL